MGATLHFGPQGTQISAVVAHRLSCSKACGIFPDQRSNPCPLHWQADSYPLHHLGSPSMFLMLTHTVTWIRRLFLFHRGIAFYCMDKAYFIHPLVDRYLGCFCFWSIMNNASMNIHIQAFVCLLAICICIYIFSDIHSHLSPIFFSIYFY